MINNMKNSLKRIISRYAKYYALIYIYLIFALLCVILNNIISLSDKFIENYIVIPTAIGFGLFVSPWFTSLGVCMFRHMQGRGNIGNWLGLFVKTISWEIGFLIYPIWFYFKHLHPRISNLYLKYLAIHSSKAFVSKKKVASEQEFISANIAHDRNKIALLLAQGANPNCQFQSGGTPLTPLKTAVLLDKIDIIKLLLKYGADPNFDFEDGLTPLGIAINNNKVEIVKLLLEYGIDVNIKDNNAETPLMLAKRKKYQDIVKLLLEHGAKDIHHKRSK